MIPVDDLGQTPCISVNSRAQYGPAQQADRTGLDWTTSGPFEPVPKCPFHVAKVTATRMARTIRNIILAPWRWTINPTGTRRIIPSTGSRNKNNLERTRRIWRLSGLDGAQGYETQTLNTYIFSSWICHAIHKHLASFEFLVRVGVKYTWEQLGAGLSW